MYSPLPDSLTIKQSAIHGLGIFTTCDITIGIDLGIAHVNIADMDFPIKNMVARDFGTLI